ncbi:MAG: cytochrome b [Thiobacillaceae bacterium]
MQHTSTSTRHPALVIGLHWLTALAVLAAYASCGDPSQAGNGLSGQIHVAAGLAVFGLTALRLPLRGLAGVKTGEGLPAWQRKAAQIAQATLYLLLILTPLAGWAALADKSGQFVLLGWSLPLPAAQALWVQGLGVLHTGLGNALIALAGLHASAALLHHYLLGDTVLARMLPARVAARPTRRP